VNIGHLSVRQPVLAIVLSVFLMIAGGLAYLGLPVAEYPEVAPPTVVVQAQYPGASAQVVADTVSTPLEQEVNGVENMLYMYSQSTADGRVSLTVTFALGTDLDAAQVLVQNRVAVATPRLPEEVRRIGVTTRKNSPDLLMVVYMTSPDETYDQLYVSNYALRQVRDRLLRLDGVGDVQMFGAATTPCGSGWIRSAWRNGACRPATWSRRCGRRTYRSPAASSASRRSPTRPSSPT
jgi:multidrug efflux pump subunit AcrB